jgi:hypothetical protein
MWERGSMQKGEEGRRTTAEQQWSSMARGAPTVLMTFKRGEEKLK